MTQEKLVPLMISISKTHRDLLRKMAAEKILDNPDEVMSAALIARQMIIAQLEKLERGQALES